MSMTLPSGIKDKLKDEASTNMVLSFNNFAEYLILPVLPQEFEIVTGLNNTVNEIVSLGEVGVIGNRKLSTFTISSFFPKEYCSYCQYTGIPEPYDAVAKIESWRDSKKPIRLTVTGTPSSIPCMIDEFKYREKGGQPGDVYYDLTLKEYRFLQVRQVQNVIGKVNTRPVERVQPKTYTVKPGDCLYTIAKKIYGNGNKYKELYEKNKKVIGNNPNIIRPGQVLKL